MTPEEHTAERAFDKLVKTCTENGFDTACIEDAYRTETDNHLHAHEQSSVLSLVRIKDLIIEVTRRADTERNVINECIQWLKKNGYTVEMKDDRIFLQCYLFEGDPGNDVMLLHGSECNATFIWSEDR